MQNVKINNIKAVHPDSQFSIVSIWSFLLTFSLKQDSNLFITRMWFSTQIQHFGLLAPLSIVIALNPQVDLEYAKYEGTSLLNGVNQFLGMRYAASPLGDNRFRLAKPPTKETGIVAAKEVCDPSF